ncbi:ABC transporter ATP-binding protein [Aeromicrobium choanae]|uniref:Iron complex transport system ATP-binding protein n=1 Tax=Aeromicrobium choanae TaxID=1736691 RepID=A0A1T4Z698_9ACTN|nr:ABC transporter ATP-binding protein [Aeromicrobium choanae]SKB09398.1 iron complex transport system ATP-binding protein [Aeromicrobium choanae]
MTVPARLQARGLSAGYDGRPVLADLDVAIPDGCFTVLVGPNASGKSTLLRALARMLVPTSGEVLLDGRPIGEYGSKEVARILGLLPQTPVAPSGLEVVDLVGRGRFPHQTWLRQWTREDERAVDEALARAGVSDLRDRSIDELSGGQRQRVWIAMALAQQTSMLLLDEPTTYLDLSHQLEVLDLCRSLQQDGSTVVAVLHDLNLAFRYADHLVVLSGGRIVAQGPPTEVVTAELVEDVFDVPCRLLPDPETGTPMIIPRSSGHDRRDPRQPVRPGPDPAP